MEDMTWGQMTDWLLYFQMIDDDPKASTISQKIDEKATYALLLRLKQAREQSNATAS